MASDADRDPYGEARRRVDKLLQDQPSLAAAIHDSAFVHGLPGAVEVALQRTGQLERIQKGGDLSHVLSPLQLEAIVRRVGRPPLLIENREIRLEPLAGFGFPAEIGRLIKNLEPLVASVGRVMFVNHHQGWGGTGWVVRHDDASDLVVTNRHVAREVAERTEDGRGVFLREPGSGVSYGAAVDFGEATTSRLGQGESLRVLEVVYLADELAPDVAVLRLEAGAIPHPLELAETEADTGDVVGLVGYPAFDPRNDQDAQLAYFHDLYGVKRFAPGLIMQPLRGGQTLTHDCTSLGGNSGSPLIRLPDNVVVGLHFSGRYGVANYAVGVASIREALSGNSSFVVRPPQRAAPPTEEGRDGVHSAVHFKGRAGYDPGFLGGGLQAPWPRVSDRVRRRLAIPSDEPPNVYEIRYTHFGVLYDAVRRQPAMTAVNIDGGRAVRIKRGADRWFADGRVPRDVQLGSADYSRLNVDRGHMVRREDPNWGDDIQHTPDGPISETAQVANDDTFHYVNAALQTAALNRGKQLWQGLENYLLGSSRVAGFRLCVFTGPVLRDDDPPVDAIIAAEQIQPHQRIPREFWKIAVMATGRDTLTATAYLLSQGELIRDLLEQRGLTEAVEGLSLGAYRTFQIAIEDLADATGYDMSAYVPFDPLTSGRESAKERRPVFRPLETLRQIDDLLSLA
jgi:endonuclease G